MFVKKDKKFVSDADKFLNHFNETHEPSASQKAEMKKNDILRPSKPKDKDEKIWEDF